MKSRATYQEFIELAESFDESGKRSKGASYMLALSHCHPSLYHEVIRLRMDPFDSSGKFRLFLPFVCDSWEQFNVE